MNYDTMSVHELVLELAEIVRIAVTKWQVADMNKIIAIESALHKAVIREASVGTKEIYDPSTGKWCVAYLIPNPEKSPFA